MKPVKFESTLLDMKDLTPTVRHFVFSAPEGFAFDAGQFVSLLFTDSTGKEQRRAYSIASIPTLKGKIELCIKNISGGYGSEYLFSLRKGAKVTFLGPMGSFRFSSEGEAVFIATGAGITPFRSMIRHLLGKGYDRKILLFHGVRYEDGLLYEDEWRNLMKKHKNFAYRNVISQPKNILYNGEKGHVQDLIRKYLPQSFEGDFYLCGLSVMIKDVQSLLKEKGIEDKKIHFERHS